MTGSRLFVSLAEEYRKLGRLKDALSALQKGLLAHPGYIAAQVAQGRVYVELNQLTDAIATFTKVLVADPGNLVAAKSLADIQLSRGDLLEAVKKYKLYRALSGDRKADEIIARLEAQVTPRPVTPSRVAAKPEPPPPPPSFQETDKGKRRTLPRGPFPAAAVAELSDAFEITSVVFDPGEDSGKVRSDDPFGFVPTRDVSLAPPPPSARPPAAVEPGPAAEPPALFLPPPSAAAPEPEKPTGRALADLYYAQGHYGEALQIYDDLVTRHPFDEELKRMRRDAEARILPAGATPVAAAPDLAVDQREARIGRLKSFLSRMQGPQAG